MHEWPPGKFGHFMRDTFSSSSVLFRLLLAAAVAVIAIFLDYSTHSFTIRVHDEMRCRHIQHTQPVENRHSVWCICVLCIVCVARFANVSSLHLPFACLSGSVCYCHLRVW